MKINDNNIKFIFYLDGNKYIVYSLNENIEIGDELRFAKEVNEGVYENVPEEEYKQVLKEYEGYLNCIGDDLYEN